MVFLTNITIQISHNSRKCNVSAAPFTCSVVVVHNTFLFVFIYALYFDLGTYLYLEAIKIKY